MKYQQHFAQILCTLIVLTTVNFACSPSSQTEKVASESDSIATVDSKEEEMPEDKSKRPSPPARAEAKVGDLGIIIDYSQPAVKGRNIFGEIVPYGEVWRIGANEATTISFDKDVVVEGQKLAAGTYALFAIPNEKEWTIIFNTKANQWGAFEYKKEEDALRVNVKPNQEKEITERVTFDIDTDGQVTMKWDKTKIVFRVSKG